MVKEGGGGNPAKSDVKFKIYINNILFLFLACFPLFHFFPSFFTFSFLSSFCLSISSHRQRLEHRYQRHQRRLRSVHTYFLRCFLLGFFFCVVINYSGHGSDDILFGEVLGWMRSRTSVATSAA